MNALITSLVLTGLVFLFRAMVKREGRTTDSEALQEEAHKRWEDKSSPLADELMCLSTARPRVIGEPELVAKPEGNVTPAIPNATDPSHCPACGALVTTHDESCPSCEISFVCDDSQRWVSSNVGPADGICLPPPR